MTDDDLRTHYLAYLRALNERRVGDLGAFVHEDLIYNDAPQTLTDYQALRAGEFATIPDLYFKIELLVVGNDEVACRLKFDVTPQREFLGFPPNGKTISFVEHVFYKFRAGKIYAVWSLLDREAIAAQLAA